LVIIDLSLLSDLDATWVARLLTEVGQAARSMEMEMWIVGSGQVVSGVVSRTNRCFGSLQAARAAEAAR
jgi:hypothetical protein